MTRRLAMPLVLAIPLISSVAFAAQTTPAPAREPSWTPAQPADPTCGGPKKPDEGPQPPKEPPKT
jgi:hypothetical protein